MKLTLRQEWRPRPLSSFLGFMDLKTGVTLALLFALLNKVAGVYGLIAVFTGAGGSFAQVSLYLYSVLGLAALAWGLRVVTDEDPKRSLYFAHLFFADHVLSTAWTVFFALVWWVYTPHDGRRQANSAAQEEMMKAGPGRGTTVSEAERAQAAMAIWNQEKGFAAAIISLGWLSKIYFAVLIYSYAIHLRRGSYRALPRSRPAPPGTAGGAAYSALADEDELDQEIEDFYRLPARHTSSSGGVGSISAFGDVSPGPGSANGRARRPGWELGKAGSPVDTATPGDETLFDEDEMGRLGKSSSAEETSASASGSSGDDAPRRAGRR